MKPVLKIIDITDDMLEKCDVSNLIRFFFKELTVEQAKKLAGFVVIGFPKHDQDSRPNCIIPEIRDYIQKLHNEDPRFPFYYPDDSKFGMHLQHVACLSPLDEIVLLPNGSFSLKLKGPELLKSYVLTIGAYMEQLGYSDTKINLRLNAIMKSIGLTV